MNEQDVFIYNGHDVINTYDINTEMKPFLDERYIDTYKFTEMLQEPLMFMMTRGVRINFEELNETKIEVGKLIVEKEASLNEIAGRELNANSSKQLQAYFYIEKGIKPYTKRNASGGQSITLDDKALQRIARGTAARKGFPEAKLIQEIRGLKKLSGTYLDITLDEDKRFRCSYRPRGTRFGRLSSAKTIFGTGMNMQNLPSQFKKFLVADPDYLMFEIDKAKAEWVVVAYLSGDPNMIRVIEEGLDPHIYTAHLMTGLPEELIAEENELIGHLTDPDEIGRIRNQLQHGSSANSLAYDSAEFLPRTMSVRQCGKKSNHGLNYDEGYKTFALSNEMLESDAKKVVQLYKYKAYPGIPIWHKNTQQKLMDDRTLVNYFGRQYKFLGAWNEDLFKAAYAFIPQSTVADLVNLGITNTYYDTRADLRELELLGQVHDSILGQFYIAPDNPSTIIVTMARAMKQVGDYMDLPMEYGGREFRIDNDLKVGPSWGKLQTVDIHSDNLHNQILDIYNEFNTGTK